MEASARPLIVEDLVAHTSDGVPGMLKRSYEREHVATPACTKTNDARQIRENRDRYIT